MTALAALAYVNVCQSLQLCVCVDARYVKSKVKVKIVS